MHLEIFTLMKWEERVFWVRLPSVYKMTELLKSGTTSWGNSNNMRLPNFMPYRVARSKIIIILLLTCIFVAFGWYKYRQSTYFLFLLHTPSDLYLSLLPPVDYKKTLIPLDSIPVDHNSKEFLQDYFKEFYVVADVETDCSFISAFMLLYRRDPDFPFRIITRIGDNSYAVYFPGADTSVEINVNDLKKYYAFLDNKRSFFRRLFKGHLPEGLQIMRCAYYKYQRSAGLRKRNSPVYGGGWPDLDLMLLSGVKRGFRFEAAQCGKEINPNNRNFDNCLSVKIQTRLVNGKPQQKVTPQPLILGNPLRNLESLDKYFVIAATNNIRDSLFGNRFVPNHAYYLIKRLSSNKYVFGNPYQTRRPLIITDKELGRRFKRLYLIPKQM